MTATVNANRSLRTTSSWQWDLRAPPGLFLLSTAAPAGLLLAAAPVVLEAAAWSAVVSLPDGSDLSVQVRLLAAPAVIGVALFGLAGLADLVRRLDASRAEELRAEVARERRRLSGDLRAAIGDRLAAVAAHGTAARRAADRDQARARTELAAAGAIARQAVAQARVVADEYRTTPAVPRSADSRTPRLAVALLGMLAAGISPPGSAVAIGCCAAIALLQIRHSVPRPPYWRCTLALQAALTYAPVAGGGAIAMGGLLAGSVLLLIDPRRVAWTCYGAVVVSVGIFAPQPIPTLVVYDGATAAVVGVGVYGMTRLTALAAELESIRRVTACVAVTAERMRVARDIHDLLGLGLSAIALKCDLAARLIGKDSARARAEIDALTLIASRTCTDLRMLTGARRRLTLSAELATAQDILASAGVNTDVGLIDAGIPPDVDAVLATLLREAVTNVLRHSDARRCAIEVTTADGVVRLRVANDGAPPPSCPTAGHGLRNLATRVAAMAGSLTTCHRDGQFALEAEIPPR